MHSRVLFALLLPCAGAIDCARAQTTPPGPSSAQPSIPQPLNGGMEMTSPVLGGGSSGNSARKALTVRKKVAARRRRHFAHVEAYRDDLERPALAGVELVAPLPHPIQPPHFTVPVPAYPLENVITFYTTPAPPVICGRVSRDPYAPDPHLLRGKAVVCAADNP